LQLRQPEEAPQLRRREEGPQLRRPEETLHQRWVTSCETP